MVKRTSQFFGVLSLVLVVFGLLAAALGMEYSPLISGVHFALGAFFVLLFFIRGGLQVLGGAALRKGVSQGLSMLLYTLLFLALLVVANLYAYRNDVFRFDSTEQKVFTLAPQSEKVIGSVDVPIVIRGFFVGGEVPLAVQQVLERVSRASDKIHWKVIDPEKDPRKTEQYGISERGTLHFSFADESSTRSVKLVRDLDEQGVINAILKLRRGEGKKLYWISGHGEANLDDATEAGFLFLKEAIEGENVVVEKLLLDGRTPIPEDAYLLLLMAPRKELLDEERRALTSYLKNGGNMLLLNEPNTTRDISELVEPLGIIVGADIILDQVLQLFTGPQVKVQPVVNRYANHPAMEDFTQNVILSTASSVRAKDAARYEATELAFTGEGSWAESDVATIFSENPTVELPDEADRGDVPVAVAYDGSLRRIAEGEKREFGGRVVVLGDSDFVANVNIRHLFNRDFFLNVLNWALGEQERISIRERTLRTSTETLQEEQIQRIFLLCGVLLPELVVLLGLIVWWRRRG